MVDVDAERAKLIFPFQVYKQLVSTLTGVNILWMSIYVLLWETSRLQISR